MKVRVDSQLCRGRAVCCSLSPEVFEITEAGYAHLVQEVVPAVRCDAVNDAVNSCPEGAISTE
jgi:ferredoxin